MSDHKRSQSNRSRRLADYTQHLYYTRVLGRKKSLWIS